MQMLTATRAEHGQLLSLDRRAPAKRKHLSPFSNIAAAMLNPAWGLSSCPASPLSPSALVPNCDIPPHAFHCNAVPVVRTAARNSLRCRCLRRCCHLLWLLVGALLQTRPKPQRRLQTFAFTQCRYTPADCFGVQLVDTIWTSKCYSWFQARFKDKPLGYFHTNIRAALARDAYVRALPAACVSNSLGRNYRVPRKLNFPNGIFTKPSPVHAPSAFEYMLILASSVNI